MGRLLVARAPHPAPSARERLRAVPSARAFLPLAVAALGVAALVAASRLGDYVVDAGPAVNALAAGSFRRAAAVPFLMGPLSVVLRAPFVWAAHRSGAGQLGSYRAGILPCLAAAGALGIVLARRSRSWGWLVVVLAVASPAALAAVQEGHPEEALGGALCVAAVLLALDRHTVWAALALGLAVATKEWALLAVAPTLLAARPGGRMKLAAGAAVTAAAVYLPFFVRDPHAFMTAIRGEAHVESSATPETVWLLAAHSEKFHVDGFPTLTYHAVAHWVPPVSHALIVLAAIPIGLLLWRRGASGADALALLALLFLLRCVLDPVDQDYFHLPFVLALLAFETWSRRDRLPLGTVAAAACLWLTFDLQAHHVAPGAIDSFYLAWTAATAAYLLLGMRLIRRRGRGTDLSLS
ncbi:MAG TPA: hypothetical protein VH063_09590 [Gaiellaceae bacterium]|jgi:hypothetical protein|nr:hypothetical protein [Gaiellaceae bacterium]